MACKACTLLLVSFFAYTCMQWASALHIIVGKDDCIGSCVNYHKAGSDAFSAIQDAFKKVKAAGGGKVTIKQGIYIVSSNLNMYSNTELVGEGMDKTILKLRNYASPWKVGTKRSAGFIRSAFKNENKCENLYVAHLTLDGNKAKQKKDENSMYGRYGYYTEGCVNVYVESVRVQKWQGYGFDPHGWKTAPGGSLYSKNLTMVNCIANHNDWDGFTLDQTNGMFLRNNTSYNNGRHGFNVVTGSRNVYITGAVSLHNGYYYYEGSSGCGITLQNNLKYGTYGITVVNSTLAYDKKCGICTNDVYNVKINKVNVVTKRECFFFKNARSFTVTNNMCNHTKIFREVNVTKILKKNNTIGMPSFIPTLYP
jgi:hypothetical protein